MNEDLEKPKLTVASSRTQAEIDREYNLDRFEWAVRQLMANLLRVMRGAGKPLYIFDHLNELFEKVQALDDVSVYDASMRFEDVLHSALKQDYDDRGVPAARTTIARGVLQMLASELIGQSTQKRAGESELHEGIDEMQAAWEENRRRWQEHWAAQQPKARPRVSRKPRAKKRIKLAGPKPLSAPEGPRENDQKLSTVEAMRMRKKELEAERSGRR